MDTINERIRIVFLQTGLTQAAFAKALDLSGPMVSMILAGKSGVSDRTILSICRCFGISEQWLRTGQCQKPCTSCAGPNSRSGF